MATKEESDVAVPKRDVGFRAIKRKQKGQAGRGFAEPADVLDCLAGDWDSLQDELLKLPDDEQDSMKEHFNNLIEEADTLGDILYGDKEEFQNVTGALGGDDLKTYTDEIIRVELVDPTV